MTTQVSDYIPILRAAISEAKSAGLAQAATELEARAFGAYTTSSEILGETGIAIGYFLKSQARSAPAGVVEKLTACLNEIRKVWPDL